MYFIIFIIIVTIAHPALALALIRSYARTLIRLYASVAAPLRTDTGTFPFTGLARGQ